MRRLAELPKVPNREGGDRSCPGLGQILARTCAVVAVHALLLVFLLEVLLIAGPNYVAHVEQGAVPKTPFFLDVIRAVRLATAHQGLAWLIVILALFLDGFFLFAFLWDGDSTLSRVWIGLVTFFLFALVVIVSGSFLIAKRELMESGYIAMLQPLQHAGYHPVHIEPPVRLFKTETVLSSGCD